MKILAVDIGTGTQDIFLYDSRLHLENGFKIVAPAPTMIRRRQIQQATQHGRGILLSGPRWGAREVVKHPFSEDKGRRAIGPERRPVAF